MELHSFDVFHSYEKAEWRMKDIPWLEIRKDLVKPEYVRIAKSVIMGECNTVAQLHSFLTEFATDYDFSAYAAVWCYQELRHTWVFKTWLEYLDMYDLPNEAIAATREPYPPGTTPSATLTTNAISEITVNHVYHFLSERVEEPVMARIMELAAHDEGRHAAQFIYYLRQRLAERPEEMSSVLETLYFYTAALREKIKHPVSVFKEGAPDFRDQFDTTIDEGFEYFHQLDDGTQMGILREKIFRPFRKLTGYDIHKTGDIRRALAEVISA